MGPIRKVGEWGVLGTIRRIPRSLRYRCDTFLYRHAYFAHRREPIDERLIVLESEGDLSDNAFALYDYMRRSWLLERYRVVWAVEDVDAAQLAQSIEPDDWPNTEFVAKSPVGIASRSRRDESARALATCRWHIYDHCNLMANLPKRAGQTIVYLSHGVGYKASKGGDSLQEMTPCDVFTVPSPLGAELVGGVIGAPTEKARVTGYPRNDYLFDRDTAVRDRMAKAFGFDRHRKVLLWMPTFRQSIVEGISEDYIDNATGLPLLNTLEDIEALSSWLVAVDALLVLKVHHLQAELPIFQRGFGNIVVVRDPQLRKLDVQLNQFIACADALITDYSSVATDYLLLDRPIVYTLDDYEQYASSRGFCFSNAKDYMPGYHVYTQSELVGALGEIVEGVDRHRGQRQIALRQFHAYRDGNSSKRVLDVVGIG